MAKSFLVFSIYRLHGIWVWDTLNCSQSLGSPIPHNHVIMRVPFLGLVPFRREPTTQTGKKGVPLGCQEVQRKPENPMTPGRVLSNQAATV